jgi:hypothetical protein
MAMELASFRFLHMVALRFYSEKCCLMKASRYIAMHLEAIIFLGGVGSSFFTCTEFVNFLVGSSVFIAGHQQG